jgi:hypothetical protein
MQERQDKTRFIFNKIEEHAPKIMRTTQNSR